MRYRLMSTGKTNFPTRWMAKRLKPSRLGFYAWVFRGEPEDICSGVHQAVYEVWLKSDRRFGTRFIQAFLPDEYQGPTLTVSGSACVG